MWPRINLKMIASAFLVVVLAGVNAAPACAQKASPEEVAKLREEVARLRADLGAVLKDIRDLKEASGGKLPARPDEGRLFRGKPARFWLAQLDDGDGEFRAEAVKAIGALAKKNKKLAQPLFNALKNDPDEGVEYWAANVLGELGPEALPGLIEIAKGKTRFGSRFNAIVAIGRMGSKAKAAVLVLAANLRDTNPGLLTATAGALEQIGPDAKEALPALVEALGASLEDIGKHDQLGSRFRSRRDNLFPNYAILDALKAIEPDSAVGLPLIPEILVSGNPGGALPKEYTEAWKKTYETLAKKYLKAK